MAQKATGKIIEGYLDKYPEMPSLTMAKLILKDNPMDFKHVEQIRSTIRQYRGKCGDKKRSLNVRGTKHYKPKEVINFAPYNMPAPESEDLVPVKLPKAINNVGIFSDFHIPNHRQEPIEVACKFFKEQGVNGLVLNGDILDNTPFTRHDGKRPSASEVRQWFDKTEMFFEWLRDYFPTADIYWTEGNHDFWYKRWMQAHAWQLDDDPYFSLQERLHIDDYKIKFIPQEQYLMAGKLAICHGHMLLRGMFAPVSAARGVYMRTKRSTIIGHVHVESSYTEPDLHGDIATCFSTGCMCTLTPAYQPMGGKACHGFAHLTIEKNGDFQLKNYRIHKGKIL